MAKKSQSAPARSTGKPITLRPPATASVAKPRASASAPQSLPSANPPAGASRAAAGAPDGPVNWEDDSAEGQMASASAQSQTLPARAPAVATRGQPVARAAVAPASAATRPLPAAANRPMIPASPRSALARPLAALSDAFFDEGDTGLETMGQSDISMPRLTILQALSPELQRGEPGFIEGAQTGHIVKKGTGEVFESIEVVPAFYQMRFLEWKPDRGGLVRDYGDDASIRNACTPDEEQPWVLWTPGGNHLVPTMTFYVVDAERGSRVIIPMSGTFSTAGRNWNLKISEFQLPGTGNGRAQGKLWSRSWVLSTAKRSNEKGFWYTWQIDEGRLLDDLGEDIISLVANFRRTCKRGALASTEMIAGDQEESFRAVSENAPM